MDSDSSSKVGLTILGVLVVILIVGGLGYAFRKRDTASPTPTPTATSTPAASNAVSISNFAFSSAALTVHVGDTVTWTNNDSAYHTVTSTDGGPLDSGNIGSGETFSYTFTSAGTYAYQCSFHPSMTGTVTVQ